MAAKGNLEIRRPSRPSASESCAHRCAVDSAGLRDSEQRAQPSLDAVAAPSLAFQLDFLGRIELAEAASRSVHQAARGRAIHDGEKAPKHARKCAIYKVRPD